MRTRQNRTRSGSSGSLGGGRHTKLNAFKNQLIQAHGKSHTFFYSPKTMSVINRPPAKTELATHTQGLDHEPLISYIAARLD
jgi:hypothetical protein